ncbi:MULTISPECIES: helix-turn-helix domain-containing protein [Stutzerimonas stutzeri group]|uniref:helix-turn-helix domain-containing protein n=1 Tax=Stutzerimonas stutzeri group TaxID=136846 RepID=UPI000F7AEBFA|nr:MULTISPECIES: helix-turn-helix domain-containing protein [Stutzerimonas stutzeri group]MBK3757979.1 helix-turn-helix domain-containing protein [Stutzerimonas frequens]MBK3872283.1 helix-turn-helix domain-containing protein [Stutzerimonas frequens]MBK3910814.1 helix-turn-helix domain-containing protein [Stutzerimonas frequens]MBK3930094.1 helix-turn-helix domain-containing protein [Stutzerimonas frequens]MDH0498489.1 helix-turn-helix domain-containing protein [Stutzerimonas stutzeri]
MNQLATLQPLAVSPEEAAHASGTTRTAVYEAIARGDLMSFKAGRRRLILIEELRAWLNRMAKDNAR